PAILRNVASSPSSRDSPNAPLRTTSHVPKSQDCPTHHRVNADLRAPGRWSASSSRNLIVLARLTLLALPVLAQNIAHRRADIFRLALQTKRFQETAQMRRSAVNVSRSTCSPLLSRPSICSNSSSMADARLIRLNCASDNTLVPLYGPNNPRSNREAPRSVR